VYLLQYTDDKFYSLDSYICFLVQCHLNYTILQYKITVNTQRQVENQGEGPSSSIGQLIILPDSLEQRLISLK